MKIDVISGKYKTIHKSSLIYGSFMTQICITMTVRIHATDILVNSDMPSLFTYI